MPGGRSASFVDQVVAGRPRVRVNQVGYLVGSPLRATRVGDGADPVTLNVPEHAACRYSVWGSRGRGFKSRRPDGIYAGQGMVPISGTGPWPALVGARNPVNAVRSAHKGGYRSMSLGADNVMVDVRYAPVLLDKLHWCGAVRWVEGSRPFHVSLSRGARDSEANVFGLLLRPEASELVVESTPDLVLLADELPALPAEKGCRT
ncbi:MAG: hypothetical protein QG608_1021 [Actinomycetota bacterium]|nr:hypothetical protein [Actinomycetota bacterium]